MRIHQRSVRFQCGEDSIWVVRQATRLKAGLDSLKQTRYLPATLSIAAAGAGLTSLIAHAHDTATPEATAWLLAGSVALGLLALIVIERALVDAERLRGVYRPLSLAMVGGGRRQP